MACADLGPDLYSEKTSFQIRSHKLNQQRNLIEEKNGNKKKFSGKVISLYNQQSVFSNSRFFLQPCTIDNTQTLSYPSNTNGNNSSSGSTHDSLPIPLVTDHLLIQASSSISNASIKDLEKIEFTPVSSFESPVISPTADPYSLVPYAHEQSSNPVLGETIILDIDGKYSISESIDHLEEPPELIPLSTSSVVCMPKDLELPKFILTPVKHNQVHYCQIHRDKHGLDKNMFPTYQMFIEDPKTNENLFILASRRRKKSKFCNYLITTNMQDLSKCGIGNIGKLRANFLGTGFIIYSEGVSPDSERALPDRSNIREELSLITYEKNIFGLRGPRRMNVFLPNLIEGKRITNQDSLNNASHQKDSTLIIKLENKVPEWNNESQTYILNFNGRVTQASVKNFQLIDEDGVIVLQFGKVGRDRFTLDYRSPLCPLQAFGIALSSFERKFGCE